MAGTGEMSRSWRNMPYSPGTMAIGATVVVGGIWYYMTYMKKKPEATRLTTRHEDTPRK
ncbi:unnamed protein product [Withania somnifera]